MNDTISKSGGPEAPAARLADERPQDIADARHLLHGRDRNRARNAAVTDRPSCGPGDSNIGRSRASRDNLDHYPLYRKASWAH